MDVDDVSGLEQFTALLSKQKQTLEVAKKRKGQRPKDMKPLGLLIHDFIVVHISQKTMDHRHMIHHSWVGEPYPPSVAPLPTLKKLHIDEMQLETHHRGFYALLRVATPPNVMTAVMVIVEDEKENGVLLQVYQQEDTEYGLAEDIAQVGGVCIVKEPYFKTMGSGECGLRVDHVTDVLWLAQDDDRIPLRWAPRIGEVDKTAKEMKEEGNAALKARNLNKAVKCYTKGLHCAATTEEIQTIKLNRSFANLKLRRYDDALADATNLSREYQVSEKGVYRAACSLYELQRFQDCRETLTTLLDNYPNNAEAKEQLLRTEKRLGEQEIGEYDFNVMYKAAEETPPYLDTATYAGPVAIKTSEGRGRGLFTTRAVVAGELLLCEKAFSYCFASKEERAISSKTSMLMNTHTKRGTMGTQASLITATVQKLLRNPSLMPSFTALYHGDYKPVRETEVDGSPLVDTFLIERIIALNVFGCPRTTLQDHFRSQSPEQQERETSYHTTGIFIKASHINHSCYMNARRSFIGDMIIVRAARAIPANSEIFFWYAAPEVGRTWEKAQHKLQNWGFQCSCVLCQQDKKTVKKIRVRRNALLQDLRATFLTPGGCDLPKAERLLAAIEKTYSAPAKDVPRLELGDPYLLLTRIYALQNKSQNVIQTAFKVLTSLGFVITHQSPDSPNSSSFKVLKWGLTTDEVIETWTHLWTAWGNVAPHLCKEAEEYARVSYKICIGEDETFDETVGKMARETMFGGIDLGTAFQQMSLRGAGGSG